jgi:NAD(P)-dependent dehydrogenase (short-subunit alcohol dehydrogenase family)
MTLPSLEAARSTIDNAKRVCLFGVGALLNECYEQLVSFLGREPDLVCDNAPEKWGTEFRGAKCVSPRELGEFGKGTAVVIAVRKHEDIYRQLRGIGIEDIFIACFDSGYYNLNAVRKLEDDPLAASDEGPSAMHLQGMWTLVTGASRGVGRQIAMAMAGLGSNIIAHSRSVSHVRELREICSSCGVQIVPIAAELSNPAELDAMLVQLDQLTPRVDIVFNNAAIAPYSPSGFWGISSDVFRDCYTVNAIAPIRICQHLLPGMIRRGFGRVININTYIQKWPGEIAYSTSKAALDKFVHDFAPELHGTGVMMTLADPGWVRTDAGGPNATYAVETVIPGILLGAALDGDINGCRFSAQEYAGLSIEEACKRAKSRRMRYARRWV